MLFKRKYDRGMEAMQDKNREYLESQGIEFTPHEKEQEKIELEKGDLTAMIISALAVFGPIFLVLGGLIAVAWVFLH